MKIQAVLTAITLALLSLISACKPAAETSVSTLPLPSEPEPTPAGGSIVSIPEEFQAAPAETPNVTLPPVVFVTTDFTITSASGLRGIRVGEAMNFIREEGDDFVVQVDGLEFKKHKSFFSSTYVEAGTPVAPVAESLPPSAPAPTPDMLPPAIADAEPTPDTITDDLPAAPGTTPAPAPLAESMPTPTEEEAKVEELTDTIRGLNEKIRTSQDSLEAKTKQPNPPSAQDVKKEARAIERLKAERDALSENLTEIGKP